MDSPTLTTPVLEHYSDSLGIGHASPRISWRFQSSTKTARDWKQTAHEIEVSRNGSTKKYEVKSEQSTLVPWPSSALSSREAAEIRVRSKGRIGGKPVWTEWSPPATVEAALLKETDWQASFVAATERQELDGCLQPVIFWKTLDLDHVDDARLYITSYGVFEVSINGQNASDECMAPGWTSYKHRLTYRTLDVGKFLKVGTNVISIHVGEGWFAGRLGFPPGIRFWYGEKLAALAQLEIAGSIKCKTDDSWQWAFSAIQSSGIYDGEILDHRRTLRIQDDITVLSKNVECLPWPSCRIVPNTSPPVRVLETRKAEKIWESPSGKILVDFGQNLVGKLTLPSVGVANGEKVTFKHAEVLENGELCLRPLRLAKARDIIIGSGKKIENWSPSFTFHGFRYVEVEGLNADQLSDLTALVMHSDMRRRGFFKCSDHLVNQFHKNVVWGMKGNFLSVPTDCPARDERLGWTGDLQVFCPTANFLHDTSGFLDSWLEDLSDETLEPERNGVLPLVVPDVIPPSWPPMPQAVWSDVAILAPYEVYRAGGDENMLKRQLKSMLAWLDHGVDRGSDRLWSFDRAQLADWLDPAAPPDNAADSRTDGTLVADAYLVHITETFVTICKHLGESAGRYHDEAEKLRKRFQQKYISPAGNLMSNTQAGLALAICFGLYDDTTMASAQLEKLVQTADFNISTGFAGTPVITKALTAVGKIQLAYRMLLEKSCPSWLYPVTQGATTIWERWDSMLPDGSINPSGMVSFNHYALGAVADWLHSTIGGISPLEPGWKVIQVMPIPGGDITSAEVSFDGPYGLVSCSWTWKDCQFDMEVVVPPNSTAVVTLPSQWQAAQKQGSSPKYAKIGSGTHTFQDLYDAGEWPPQRRLGPIEPPLTDITEWVMVNPCRN